MSFRLLPFRLLLLASVLASISASASEAGRKLVVEMLGQTAAAHPASADLLNILKSELGAGRMEMAEVDQILSIGIRLGRLPDLAPQPPKASVATLAKPTQGMDTDSFQRVLAGETPTMAPAAKTLENQAEPTKLPVQDKGTDKPKTPAKSVKALITKIDAIKAGMPLIVFIDKGSEAGLSEQDRLRIEREGNTLVLGRVLKTVSKGALVVIFEDTWAPNRKPEERILKVGDAAVSDE